jgi:hypothetical protein
MARTRVADFERDLNEAPGGFADELLCTDDTLSRNELQRRRPRCVVDKFLPDRRLVHRFVTQTFVFG